MPWPKGERARSLGLERLYFEVWHANVYYSILSKSCFDNGEELLPSANVLYRQIALLTFAFRDRGRVQREYLLSEEWSEFYHDPLGSWGSLSSAEQAELKERYKVYAERISNNILRQKTACDGCGQLDSGLACGGCRMPYCSPACQAQSWRSHKAVCGKRRELMAHAQLAPPAAAAAAIEAPSPCSEGVVADRSQSEAGLHV